MLGHTVCDINFLLPRMFRQPVLSSQEQVQEMCDNLLIKLKMQSARYTSFRPTFFSFMVGELKVAGTFLVFYNYHTQASLIQAKTQTHFLVKNYNVTITLTILLHSYLKIGLKAFNY